MDSFERIKKITFQMLAEQEEHIDEARAANKDLQLIGELIAKQVGIRMVYNKILQIERNSEVVSDEALEDIWRLKREVSGPKLTCSGE